MPHVDLKHVPVRPPNPLIGWEQKAHLTLFLLFIVSAVVVWMNLWIWKPWFGSQHWPEGCLLLACVASTLASLCRQLPAQNVIFGATLIGLLTGAVLALNGLAGVPFGPMDYHRDNVGQFLLSPLPWAVPLIWVISILNARGVARLVLRSRRRAPNYGFKVMGLTVALVLVFELSFQPYATLVKEYWTWKPTKLPSSWYGTPWTNFLGGAVVCLLTLLFVTPILINKSPVQKPVSYHSLLVWEILGLLFLTGTMVHHLNGVSVFTLAQMIGVVVLCFFGTRRKIRPEAPTSSSVFPTSIT